MTQTKTFDISTLKGLKQAERFKAKLENMGLAVSTTPSGFNRVTISGR